MNYHKTKGFEGLLGFPELARSQGLMKRWWLKGRNLKPSGKKSENCSYRSVSGICSFCIFIGVKYFCKMGVPCAVECCTLLVAGDVHFLVTILILLL